MLRWTIAVEQGDHPPPPFRLIHNTFLEHHVTTRQQAIMEKGKITFKLNSHL